MTAAAQVIEIDDGIYNVLLPAGVTEVDVTDIVLSGHLSILPGFAYDKHNDRVWVHSKLFHTYTRIDTAAGKWYINAGWFDTKQYETLNTNYNEYVRYIKRNAKEHLGKNLQSRMTIHRSAGGKL